MQGLVAVSCGASIGTERPYLAGQLARGIDAGHAGNGGKVHFMQVLRQWMQFLCRFNPANIGCRVTSFSGHRFRQRCQHCQAGVCTRLHKSGPCSFAITMFHVQVVGLYFQGIFMHVRLWC
jgi:hypothetical protein